MYNYSQPIIWVNGEEGAKAYMVSPNHTVALWDSESQTIFLTELCKKSPNLLGGR